MSTTTLSFHEKVVKLQTEVSVPKGQFNSFGKYNYRSCEDILAAMKPLLKELCLYLSIRDDLEMIGDRYYVRAIVTLSDGTNKIETSAYARESFDKKGMDDAQVTGSTSSYSRKYALSGLLGLDDEVDSDSGDKTPTQDEKTGSRFASADPTDPGSYVIPMGKFNGKKISEVPRKDLTDYCVELTEKNKQMEPGMKKFIDLSREFLRTAVKN